MPYTVEWLVPKRVILTTFDKILTLVEFSAYDMEVIKMLDEGESKQVHFLCDVTTLLQFPSLTHLINLSHVQHPNLGWGILVGTNNPIIKTMALITSKLFGQRVKICVTREQALASLQQIDSTLIQLK